MDFKRDSLTHLLLKKNILQSSIYLKSLGSFSHLKNWNIAVAINQVHHHNLLDLLIQPVYY